MGVVLAASILSLPPPLVCHAGRKMWIKTGETNAKPMVDSIANPWLVEEGKQQLLTTPQRGLVVRSQVGFFLSLSYPSVAEFGHNETWFQAASRERKRGKIREGGSIRQAIEFTYYHA